MDLAQVAALEVPVDEADDMLQRLIGVSRGVRDARESDRRHLPEVLPIDLGDRDVEAVLNSLNDRLDDPALILERAGFGELNGELTDTEDHGHLLSLSNGSCAPDKHPASIGRGTGGMLSSLWRDVARR